MSGDLLQTKLYVPRLRPSLVPRPHLIAKLNQGWQQESKLTLVSAPAGFGKTTLITEWLNQIRSDSKQKNETKETSLPPSSFTLHPYQVAWLSLDEGDADLVRFLTYFIAALQTVAANVGAEVLRVLQSPQLPPTQSILTSLLNDIMTISEHFFLVLDDYHVVDTRLVDEALTFLLEQSPPQMHMIITTREDPNLPLARWRVRNQLTELRASDLRFSLGETAVFLQQIMGLTLTEENIAILEDRTEGWIAGLQLAALSMQGRQDVSGFIDTFTGDNRYIVDYLVEEVLHRQPGPTRSFLLQTAILDRLNGSLCDAVTGQTGSKVQLETLERGNFFVIPLDDRRHWYRYHHLFAEVLKVHLLAEQTEHVSELHRRASNWYEQHDSMADAIRHAMLAEDFERAADLIEQAVLDMRQSRQEATLLGWFQALPDELFKNRPVLTIHYAGTLLQNGHLDGVEFRLRAVEQWLEMPENIREQPVYVNEEDFRRLPGSVAMYHAGIALIQGDTTNTIKYAQQVLAIAPKDDNFLRGAASALLGLAFWTCGDLDTAHQVYAEGMAYLQKAGYISDVIGGTMTLADIQLMQGRLREAMSSYKHGLKLATKQGAPPLRGVADMHVGLSELECERNDLDAAEQHLLKSKELGELNGLPKNPSRWRVTMARIREAQGDLDGALDLLEEAERLYVDDFSPNVRPISALKIRIWLAQGRLAEAFAWARVQKLSTADDLNYLREFEHITLARILLADRTENALREATGLLERLLIAAEEGKRMGRVIEILILQALAYQASGDLSKALSQLERALKLAEPEGYMRIFLDEGASMMQLLKETAVRGIMPDYTNKLLGSGQTSSKSSIPASTSPALMEPLSQRELDILRLFQTELSGPEIAVELMVALSTVRTHTKGIYSKLNVNNRRAAVNRAIELGLI